MTTVVYGDFEWDDDKAAGNVRKHGVSFEEAATALIDPGAVFFSEDASDEARLVAIGMSQRARVLFVVHVERGERDRIVSARIASPTEEVLYEQGS